MKRVETRRRKKQAEYFFDYTLLFIVLFLLGFGLIMVYSTSSYEASMSASLNYDEAYYLKHQAGATVLGLVAMMVVSRIPYHFWEPFAIPDDADIRLLDERYCQTMADHYHLSDDPEYMAGLTLGFSWKNWEVSTQWTGAWNVSRMISDVFRQPFFSSADASQGGLLAYHLDNTWTEDNPSQSSKYPRATFVNRDNNYATSTLYEQDSKYLRLKTLQVAYNFNLPVMKKLGLNTFQLAFSGYNLWTLTPYLWGDPETRASNAPSYPLSKTYTLSLKLGF